MKPPYILLIILFLVFSLLVLTAEERRNTILFQTVSNDISEDEMYVRNVLISEILLQSRNLTLTGLQSEAEFSFNYSLVPEIFLHSMGIYVLHISLLDNRSRNMIFYRTLYYSSANKEALRSTVQTSINEMVLAIISASAETFMPGNVTHPGSLEEPPSANETNIIAEHDPNNAADIPNEVLEPANITQPDSLEAPANIAQPNPSEVPANIAQPSPSEAPGNIANPGSPEVPSSINETNLNTDPTPNNAAEIPVVPYSKNDPEVDDDWRNKMWYFSFSVAWAPRAYIGEYLSAFFPNACIGAAAEFHFFDRFSAEAGLSITTDWVVLDPTRNIDFRDILLEIPISFKYVFKPSTHFMLEPYAGLILNISIYNTIKPPPVSWMLGFQYGVKAGPGVFFIDSRFSMDITKARLNEIYGRVEFNRIKMYVGAGYKISFF